MAIPNGTIILLSDVPINNNYENTIDFKDADEQFAYWRSFRKLEIDEADDYSYIRREREYLSVNRNIAEIEDVNYMIFKATENDRLYYAFVIDKHYINEDTTEIFFEVDVMQTFMFDYKFNESYIAQAHVDRWTKDHKPIYSRTDEGLDYGSDYEMESGYRIKESNNVKWAVIYTTQHKSIIGGESIVDVTTELNPVDSPFVVYVVPIILNKNIKRVSATFTEGDAGTKTLQIGDLSNFQYCMKEGVIGYYTKEISLIPYLPAVYSERIEGEMLYVDFGDDIRFSKRWLKLGASENVDTSLDLGALRDFGLPFLVLMRAEILKRYNLAETAWDSGITESIPSESDWNKVKGAPYTTPRNKRFESKLLCYPYRYNILSDNNACNMVVKNEYIKGDKIAVKASLSFAPNTPSRFWIEAYKNDIEGRQNCLYKPLAGDYPITSDEYFTYMLQNRNTQSANMTNLLVGKATGVGMSIVDGARSGGLVGAALGAFNSGVDAVVSVTSEVRSLNAKYKDLQTLSDNVNVTNDGTFALTDDSCNLAFYRMRLAPENEDIIADILFQSGYKVNRIAKPDLRSRARFNYIQTVGANITGGFSQIFLAKIKAIYDKGITIWHYRETDFNPLDYSYENIEVNLL